jgi:DNA replication protein DnaC
MAGVPVRYRTATFRNSKISKFNEAHAKTCWYYSQNPKRNVFMYGDAGTGKTHHTALILRELILRDQKVRFVSVPRLILENISPVTARKYSLFPFIALDDFGLGKNQKLSRQIMEYIISERYSECKSSIITSDLSPENVADKMGKRMASRIFSSCLVMKFEGPDQRFSLHK